jgi:hypothetical protein
MLPFANLLIHIAKNAFRKVAFVSSSPPRPHLNPVQTLIMTHIQRYPDIEIMDIYRLLHQSVFGPGYEIQNLRAAREWLERELEKAAPPAGDHIVPLVESVHPDGAFVRLALWPYRGLNGKMKLLLGAYIESGRQALAQPTDKNALMHERWAAFQAMTEGGILTNRFAARTVQLVGRAWAKEQWPSSHHSPKYDYTYKPNYRVLLGSSAETLLQGQKIKFSLV